MDPDESRSKMRSLNSFFHKKKKFFQSWNISRVAWRPQVMCVEKHFGARGPAEAAGSLFIFFFFHLHLFSWLSRHGLLYLLRFFERSVPNWRWPQHKTRRIYKLSSSFKLCILISIIDESTRRYFISLVIQSLCVTFEKFHLETSPTYLGTCGPFFVTPGQIPQTCPPGHLTHQKRTIPNTNKLP